jgi:epoxyqueuosine reductase QueG
MSDPRIPVVENRDATNSQVNRSLTESLKEHLVSLGADLVGFGPAERLRKAPDIMQPRRYLRDAASLVSIALRVNEASCDLIAESIRGQELPASYHSYQMFTLTIINPQLDRLAYLAAKFLEQKGYRAYPFPANLPHLLKPSAEYPGGPGDISHKHVAVACGLGRIGWHTLLITPQFGTRQKLVSIVTNAPLVPDPLCNAELCDPRRCGFQCARACPTAAIPANPNRSIRIDIGGMSTEYADIVGWRCRWGCSGMLQCTGGYKDIALPEREPTAEELLRYKSEVDPWQQRLRSLSGLIPFCGRCLCICPTPEGRAAGKTP